MGHSSASTLQAGDPGVRAVGEPGKKMGVSFSNNPCPRKQGKRGNQEKLRRPVCGEIFLPGTTSSLLLPLFLKEVLHSLALYEKFSTTTAFYC
jgi:hypothetical protein